MTNSDNSMVLSPTVVHVIEQFIAAMRADEAIDEESINRLETLLQQGLVPKPDDINVALFKPSPDGEI